ncbi:futalosine hydrolase [Salipaludibacillus sp. HK11]|uniref:futalosine hydrolase n=1 Tax=Salipaludibacillus sp. HK11 TaxID=3394320 RepID=UPI0039FDAD89
MAEYDKNFDKKILIVTSVEVEQTAIVKSLKDDFRFRVETLGVGPMLAAAKTAEYLTKDTYDIVINMGIAGGFPNVANIGDVVVASEVVAADLGAESPEGFKPIEQLGFGKSHFECDNKLAKELINKIDQQTDVKAHLGTILTRSTVTGTVETMEQLQKQVPGAAAEAMEGFGVATAAQLARIPFFEIRAISNPVGPRDRGAWKINEALVSLTKVSAILKEVF